MERKASAYAKVILVLAVIFIGFPVAVYALFSATRSAWDMAGAVFSSSRGSLTLTTGDAREAKRPERGTRKTFAWIAVFGVGMIAVAFVSAAGMMIRFRKKPGKRTTKRKHRRRRHVRVKM